MLIAHDLYVMAASASLCLSRANFQIYKRQSIRSIAKIDLIKQQYVSPSTDAKITSKQ